MCRLGVERRGVDDPERRNWRNGNSPINSGNRYVLAYIYIYTCIDICIYIYIIYIYRYVYIYMYEHIHYIYIHIYIYTHMYTYIMYVYLCIYIYTCIDIYIIYYVSYPAIIAQFTSLWQLWHSGGSTSSVTRYPTSGPAPVASIASWLCTNWKNV